MIGTQRRSWIMMDSPEFHKLCEEDARARGQEPEQTTGGAPHGRERDSRRHRSGIPRTHYLIRGLSL